MNQQVKIYRRDTYKDWVPTELAINEEISKGWTVQNVVIYEWTMIVTYNK